MFLDNVAIYTNIGRVICDMKKDVRFRFFVASLLLSEFQSVGRSESRVIEAWSL